MRLRKTLAFCGEEAKKPQKIRKLAFALTFSLPLLAACGAHATSLKSGSTLPAQPVVQARLQERQRPTRPAGPACGSGLESLLQPGETIRQTVCRFGRDYVMTNTSLLIVTRTRESISFEPISLAMYATRTDMGQLQEQGIADWEPSEDSVFVLTKNDRLLTRLPNEGMGDTVPAYTMPFDTSALGSESMVYYSGFLFIAPRGANVMALSFDGGFQSRSLPLRSQLADAGFFTRSNTLIFGKAGVEETEMRVEGTGINSIRTIRRI
ncbi:MAG: hypothetical protein V1861_04095 [Candidatus Micrarchaeota archaeon]